MAEDKQKENKKKEEKHPKEQEFDNIAAEELKRLVKSMIAAKGYTMETLAEEINKKYFTRESKANLSNKLKRGSLRYIDMQRIADVLGYSITFLK